MNQIKEQEKTIECSPNETELTLAQHGFEMPGSTYMWIFSIANATVLHIHQFSSLSHVQLCDPMDCSTPTSLFITNSQTLLKLMSIKSVMPSNHLILCCPLLLLPSIFPSIRVFLKESVLHLRWPSIGVSASAPVFPMSTQDWFPLRLTGLISLQSKGLSRVFSNTTVQKHLFFSTQPFL